MRGVTASFGDLRRAVARVLVYRPLPPHKRRWQWLRDTPRFSTGHAIAYTINEANGGGGGNSHPPETARILAAAADAARQRRLLRPPWHTGRSTLLDANRARRQRKGVCAPAPPSRLGLRAAYSTISPRKRQNGGRTRSAHHLTDLS